MSVTLKPVSQQRIVITGASSGIGLATARAAAKRGAKLVLASRSGDALAKIAEELKQQDVDVIHVAADVSKTEDVERIAAAAIDSFGGFDTWVNNAGLSIFGKLEEISNDDHRRLFEVNFWGLVYGSLVAAKHLKANGGSIINLGSVASDVVIPLQSMYCASKHAIRGFTDGLRMELEAEGAPISVTLIKPCSINTPFPQNAKNYMAQEPMLPPPVYQPEEVANAILHAAERPIRDIYVGGGGRVLAAFGETARRAMDWLGENVMMKQEQRQEPPRDPTGTLNRPGSGGQARGDHPGYVMKTSLYTRAALHPAITGAVLAAAGVALATVIAAPPRRRSWHDY